MTNQVPDPSATELLHELAERLQTSSAYLSAARRLRALTHSPRDLDRALSGAESELQRAAKAFNALRLHLAGWEPSPE